jgi:hypothetical protein
MVPKLWYPNYEWTPMKETLVLNLDPLKNIVPSNLDETIIKTWEFSSFMQCICECICVRLGNGCKNLELYV